MHVVDAGTLRERVVVDAAPALSMASDLMVGMWKDGLAPYVDIDRDKVTFGTEGEGLGRVTYEIGPSVPHDALPAARRLDGPWRFLGRVA